MAVPRPLAELRLETWASLPSSPGVYWWYFPLTALDQLRIAEFSMVSSLRFRNAPDSMVCLYHGMANNVRERVAWHADQKLTPSALRSGFLSTFRLTLLALNDFDYLQGATQINGFFDGLAISWKETRTREEAEEMERVELQGNYCYPLNIQGNRNPELTKFIRHLKSTRSQYRRRFIQATTLAT